MIKKRFLSMLVLLAAVVTGAVAQTTYKVSVKEGTEDATNWTITPAEATTTGVAAGTEVKATYGGTKKVKSVKAVKKAPAGPPSWKLTLSSPAKDLCIIANGGVIAQQTLDVASTEFTVEMPELTSQTVNIVATDGSGNCWYCTQENMSFAIGQTYQSSPTMTALDEDNSKPLYKITGTSDVTIPADKTVVLSGVNISSGSITCEGNTTMILMGDNTVTATTNEKAAIKIGGSGTTLTITGSGLLTAQGGKYGAGIGTDGTLSGTLSGGNIVINGGTVTATGGMRAAGIGTGLAEGMPFSASITFGDITINGGTVIATGGMGAAGIGTGLSTGKNASNECGAITIGTGVISVTATKGQYSPNSIGKGDADSGGTQTCGTITIGGTVYPDGVTTSPFTYEPAAQSATPAAMPTLTLGEMTQGGDPLNNGSGSETYFSPTFSEGQRVAVFYQNTSGQTVKVLSDALTASDISNEGKSATINVTIDDADKTQPVTYFYPATMAKDDGSINFNFTAQDGDEAPLSTVRKCCKGSGAWDGNALPSVSMASQIAIWKLTMKYNLGNYVMDIDAQNVTVKVGGNTVAYASHAPTSIYYLALNPATMGTGPLRIEARESGITYYIEKSGVSLTAGKYYQSTLTMDE